MRKIPITAKKGGDQLIVTQAKLPRRQWLHFRRSRVHLGAGRGYRLLKSFAPAPGARLGTSPKSCLQSRGSDKDRKSSLRLPARSTYRRPCLSPSSTYCRPSSSSKTARVTPSAKSRSPMGHGQFSASRPRRASFNKPSVATTPPSVGESSRFPTDIATGRRRSDCARFVRRPGDRSSCPEARLRLR
jgi:hypothetical protein